MIEIDGITVEIIKKQIKNYIIHVKPPDGSVTLSVPFLANEEKIRSIIAKRLSWIKKKQQLIRESVAEKEQEFISGEIIYIWGKPFTLKVIPSIETSNFVIDGEIAILTINPKYTSEQKDLYIQYILSKQMKDELKILIPKWEQKTGLHCHKWRINYLKGKWGVCRGRTKSITINPNLVYKPKECLEFIVVHELGHIKIPNHGKDFILFMDEYLPNWRDLEKILNG